MSETIELPPRIATGMDSYATLTSDSQPGATDSIKSPRMPRTPQTPTAPPGTATSTSTCPNAVEKPCKENSGWRRIVRNFTPSWFAVNMGTGIVSILLHNLPYNADWIRYISYAFFVLNIALFITFTVITIARYALYPEIWGAMLHHPAQSLFLGCFPMGFATIINMIVFVCAPWGNWVIYLAWGLWWFDVVVSLASCLVVPYIVTTQHKVEIGKFTAAFLLPIVPVVVASATGGIVAEVLPNTSHQVTTIVTSYIIWGLGQVFSFYVMTIYFLRLLCHNLPPREVIVSVFLPIGPLGQGGFGIQQLGKVAKEVLPKTAAFGRVGAEGGMNGGDFLYMFGIMSAFVMWGAGLGWLAFALMSISTTRQFPFNMGWWGFTFPLGVLTTCTGLLAQELSSTFFKVVCTIFSLSVLLLWMLVAFKTLRLALSGELFFAPCLKDIRPKVEQSSGDRIA